MTYETQIREAVRRIWGEDQRPLADSAVRFFDAPIPRSEVDEFYADFEHETCEEILEYLRDECHGRLTSETLWACLAEAAMNLDLWNVRDGIKHIISSLYHNLEIVSTEVGSMAGGVESELRLGDSMIFTNPSSKGQWHKA